MVGLMMKGNLLIFIYLFKLFFYLGYISNDQSSKAIDLFHKTKNPDHVIYILLFNACARLGSTEALNIIKKVSSDIPQSCRSNDRLHTSLIDALVKCGDVETAESLLNSTKNITIYTVGAMMKGSIVVFLCLLHFFLHQGYVANNQATKAIDLFHKTTNPNDVIYILLLNACATTRFN